MLKVPNMNVLDIFAQIIAWVMPAIHCCTNNEAENLAIFLVEWLKMLNQFSNIETWQRECADYDGFKTKIGNEAEQSCIISHGHYCGTIFEEFHFGLATFMLECLKNPKDKLNQTRSALKVLFRIRSVFPKDKGYAEKLISEVQKIVALNKEIK